MDENDYVKFKSLSRKFKIGDHLKLDGKILKVVKICGNVVYCKEDNIKLKEDRK